MIGPTRIELDVGGCAVTRRKGGSAEVQLAELDEDDAIEPGQEEQKEGER